MKYLKLFEDIDWEDWDYEEECMSLKDLEKCFIKYENIDECLDISNKLLELGYSVYELSEIDYEYRFWTGFMIDDYEWSLANNFKINPLTVIDYDEFIEIYNHNKK